jgi:hypothetical protein
MVFRSGYDIAGQQFVMQIFGHFDRICATFESTAVDGPLLMHGWKRKTIVVIFPPHMIWQNVIAI